MAEAHSLSRPHRRTDHTLTFETGQLASRANGAVTVRQGQHRRAGHRHRVQGPREGADFSPTVDIEERMYAAGKIPGSFFRPGGQGQRPGHPHLPPNRPPVAPMLPDGFRNEVHVVGTILGADLTNPHDVVAINGASAALSL